MKFRIKDDATTVSIQIEELGGKQGQVLKSLQACSEGRCTCPTGEYDKLDAMQLAQAPDRIAVTLKPKASQRLERSAIEACVQHTIDEAERE